MCDWISSRSNVCSDGFPTGISPIQAHTFVGPAIGFSSLRACGGKILQPLLPTLAHVFTSQLRPSFLMQAYLRLAGVHAAAEECVNSSTSPSGMY